MLKNSLPAFLHGAASNLLCVKVMLVELNVPLGNDLSCHIALPKPCRYTFLSCDCFANKDICFHIAA